jgi:hypothetical protein
MADLSITISNRMRFRLQSTGSNPSLWGTFVWGTDNWWGDYDTKFEYDQWIALSLSLGQTIGQNIDKWLAEGVSLSDAVRKLINPTALANGISFSSAIASTVISQGDWTQAARDTETWTEATPDTETWTEATAASTTWS